MLQLDAIDGRTLDLLTKLSALPALSDFRLVGGTALALQMGHRLSIDLDFFSDKNNDLTVVESSVSTLPEATLQSGSGYALFYSISGIKVDILNYPYSFRFPLIEYNGIRLAAIEDIISMKLKTIMNRGAKKDFYDLFFILKVHPFKSMIELFIEKYKNVEPFSLYKSLNCFEDADMDPDPVLLHEKNVTWQGIKKEIIKQTKAYFH